MLDLLLADLDCEFGIFTFLGDTELFADTPPICDHHVGVILHGFDPIFHDFLIGIILVEEWITVDLKKVFGEGFNQFLGIVLAV